MGFDAEGRIEFAAKVFQRDRGGQFDDLRLAVMLLQPGEQRVIDPLVGDRHPLSVFERDPFGFAEQSAIAPARNRGQPFFALIAFPHTEGIDVDSERAAVDRGDPQRDERHQPLRQFSGLLDRGTEQSRHPFQDVNGSIFRVATQTNYRRNV